MICWEYPLPWLIPGTALHRSIVARLAVLPFAVLTAVLLYQGTNPAIYYLIGMGIYLWGYNEGEVSYNILHHPDRQTSNLIIIIDCLHAMESSK